MKYIGDIAEDGTVQTIADGAITDGKPVLVNADGTVSQVSGSVTLTTENFIGIASGGTYASAAEAMAKADRDKKIFRKNLAKVAKRGTVDEKDYDIYGKRIKKKFGGSLKSVPADKKGLAKLPTKVRNKMGFMKKGGKVR